MSMARGDLFMRAVSKSMDDDNQRLADVTGFTLNQVRWLRRTHRLHELYNSDGQLITRTMREIEGRGISGNLAAAMTEDMRPDRVAGRNPVLARALPAELDEPPSNGNPIDCLLWLHRHREG